MGIFGWSLPPGCSTLPGEEPEPVQPRCGCCGAFLSWDSSSSRKKAVVEKDCGSRAPAGAKNVEKIESPWPGEKWYSWEYHFDLKVEVWVCSNCGMENELTDY